MSPPPGPPVKLSQQVPAGNSLVLQAGAVIPAGAARCFHTQKAVKSPKPELGMTPAGESRRVHGEGNCALLNTTNTLH